MKALSARFEKARREDGFTVVELTIVIIVSVIMLAGMVALLTGAFDIFNSSKDLEAITDSARRAMPAMARVLRGALHFDNANCTEDKIVFWSDIDYNADDANEKTQGDLADVDNYTQAEMVELIRYGSQAKINVTEPGGTYVATGAATPKLCSNVTRLQFYYFQSGVTPGGSDPYNPTRTYTGSDINDEVGMVRIVMTLEKGDVTRNFHQDVFLRALVREE
jgi:Tfp pilus assembly protein PilW